MTKAGKRLIAAAEEMVAIARGEQEPARIHIPPEINVGEVRKSLGLSQQDFAAEFGFTITQVRDWEQDRSSPVGGVRVYLMMIAKSPKKVRKLLGELRETA